MKQLICNPLNLEYRFQIRTSPMGNQVYREAADPTVVLFKDTYYLFASMSGGFWYSDDLYTWQFKETPELPIYDYAPDVREIGGRVLFSASRRGTPCTFFVSADPLNEPFAPVSSPFDFWDPATFQDDDGRVYFYWGCTNSEPIWGVEMDPVTMLPLGEKQAMLAENEACHGWERKGENNKLGEPKTEMEKRIREYVGTKPFIEGAFMTKYKGRYYLQYAGPGTECNVYADGVYVGDGPLGPFTYQAHNPFSSKPGGFITSAGHGSTFQDKAGNWWHISTMHISENENFERRLGLFPCGFDEEGTLYCNQNFADYPFALPQGVRSDIDATAPIMQLLSYNKPVTASSYQPGFEPEKAADENIRSWWAAETAGESEWLQLDLGKVYAAQAIQLNFAEHRLALPAFNEADMHKESIGSRLILVQPQRTRFLLEGSTDGQAWFTIQDARAAETDRTHDFIALAEPTPVRYLRLSAIQLALGGVAAVSGLRVFGQGEGEAPAQVGAVEASRTADGLNILLHWQPVPAADGYNVRYGLASDKLYSCWQVNGTAELDLSMVNSGTGYYLAVDAFNENGFTLGNVFFVS